MRTKEHGLWSTVSWTIRTTLLVIALGFIFGLGFGFTHAIGNWFLSYVWLLAFLLTTVTVTAAMRRARDGRAGRVLSYVNSLLQRNHPLPQGLLAAARSERGRVGRRLEHLGELFFDGSHTFGQALERALPELPRYEARRLAAAEKTGQLPAAMKRLIERQRVQANHAADRALDRGYGWTILTIVLALYGVVGLFILPKFDEMFADWESTLPPFTVAVFRVSSHLYGWVGLIVGGIALFLFASAASTFLSLLVARRPPTAGLGRAVLAWLPPFRGILCHEQHGEALAILERSVAAGVPLDNALREVEMLPLTGGLRHGYRRWAASERRGEPIATGARRARLGRHAAQLLASAAAGGSLAEALGFLAHRSRIAAERRRTWLTSLCMPAVVLVLGSLVAMVCLALFLPLEQLLMLNLEPAARPEQWP